MHGEGEAVARSRTDLAIDLVERFGVVAQRADRLRDVDGERVLDRLADIEALEHGERLGVALHEVGERKEDALLVAVVEVPPASVIEGAPRGGHGVIDIALIALGDAVDHRAVARRHVVEGAARTARLETAVDHRLTGKLDHACDFLEMCKRRHDISLTRLANTKGDRAE